MERRILSQICMFSLQREVFSLNKLQQGLTIFRKRTRRRPPFLNNRWIDLQLYQTILPSFFAKLIFGRPLSTSKNKFHFSFNQSKAKKR